MKKAVVAFAFAAILASPARGEGALAVGVPEGGPKNGYAYTLHVRNQSADEAEKRAIEGCRKQAQNYGVPENLCRIVASFRGKCVSVAFDTQDRSAGWAVAETAPQASAEAVKQCAQSGARNCKPHNTDCDR